MTDDTLRVREGETQRELDRIRVRPGESFGDWFTRVHPLKSWLAPCTRCCGMDDWRSAYKINGGAAPPPTEVPPGTVCPEANTPSGIAPASPRGSDANSTDSAEPVHATRYPAFPWADLLLGGLQRVAYDSAEPAPLDLTVHCITPGCTWNHRVVDDIGLGRVFECQCGANYVATSLDGSYSWLRKEDGAERWSEVSRPPEAKPPAEPSGPWERFTHRACWEALSSPTGHLHALADELAQNGHKPTDASMGSAVWKKFEAWLEEKCSQPSNFPHTDGCAVFTTSGGRLLVKPDRLAPPHAIIVYAWSDRGAPEPTKPAATPTTWTTNERGELVRKAVAVDPRGQTCWNCCDRPITSPSDAPPLCNVCSGTPAGSDGEAIGKLGVYMQPNVRPPGVNDR